MARTERGFTLIELLVVILIIGILAAIAIPVFLRQREKGYQAQIRSALKNAATAVESYGTENGGDYGGLNALPQLENRLKAQGFVIPDWARPLGDAPTGGFRVRASGSTSYCIEIRHESLDSAEGWYRATFESSVGQPSETPDTCP